MNGIEYRELNVCVDVGEDISDFIPLFTLYSPYKFSFHKEV